MEKIHFPVGLIENVQGNSLVADGGLCLTACGDDFYMPAVWKPHKQTWLLWSERPDVWRLGG